LIHLEVKNHDRIDNVIYAALVLRNRNNEDVEFVFNDIRIVVTKNSNYASIHDEYYNEMDKQIGFSRLNA